MAVPMTPTRSLGKRWFERKSFEVCEDRPQMNFTGSQNHFEKECQKWIILGAVFLTNLTHGESNGHYY
jgi:hypothetical protein